MYSTNDAATAANDLARDASEVVDDATAAVRAAAEALLIVEASIDPPSKDTLPEVHAIYVARLQLEADCIEIDEGSAAGDLRRARAGLIRVGDAAALLSIAAASLARSEAPAEREAAHAARVVIASIARARSAALERTSIDAALAATARAHVSQGGKS